MYKLLEDFEESRREGKALSNVLERFKFFKKEQSRKVSLTNLRTWRKRLGTIVGRAHRKSDDRHKAVSSRPKIPSPKLRTLSQRILTALWNYWSCDCGSQHEARFCLASCGNAGKDFDDSEIYFDFLINNPNGQTIWHWREATVTIRGAARYDLSPYQLIFARIQLTLFLKFQGQPSPCRAAESMRLYLQRAWRNVLRPATHRRPRDVKKDLATQPSRAQLTYLETKPAVTFETMLESYTAPSLIEMRRLALIFACSLMQLHESPWLSENWNKDCIHFLFHSSNGIDLRRPYLSASFDEFPSRGELPDLNRFHKNIGILRLGILLVEVHKWKPLESFGGEKDLNNGMPTPNTDMLVAKRVLSSLDDCFQTYRGAIESCLNMPWASGSSTVSLQDPETGNGVCHGIIEPLKQEVAFGSGALT